MFYVELNFSGDIPSPDVRAATNYAVLGKNKFGTRGIVKGEFNSEQLSILGSASKTLISFEDADATILQYNLSSGKIQALTIDDETIYLAQE